MLAAASYVASRAWLPHYSSHYPNITYYYYSFCFLFHYPCIASKSQDAKLLPDFLEVHTIVRAAASSSLGFLSLCGWELEGLSVSDYCVILGLY